MAQAWYAKVDSGEIKSTNFQLHPPRGQNSNVIRNKCGNLEYPLLFSAERTAETGKYATTELRPEVMVSGLCSPATVPAATLPVIDEED